MAAITDKKTMDVLFRLGFIASAKAGERFNTVSYTICGNNFVDRCWRAAFARSESRSTTISFIHRTLIDGIDMLFDANISPDLFSHLHKALMDTVAGMEALKITYADDRMQVSILSTLISVLGMETSKITFANRMGVAKPAIAESYTDE